MAFTSPMVTGSSASAAEAAGRRGTCEPLVTIGAAVCAGNAADAPVEACW